MAPLNIVVRTRLLAAASLFLLVGFSGAGVLFLLGWSGYLEVAKSLIWPCFGLVMVGVLIRLLIQVLDLLDLFKTPDGSE